MRHDLEKVGVEEEGFDQRIPSYRIPSLAGTVGRLLAVRCTQSRASALENGIVGGVFVEIPDCRIIEADAIKQIGARVRKKCH
jgi:hypothetical protein